MIEKEFVLVSQGIEIMRTKSQEKAINIVKKENDEYFDYQQKCYDNYERSADNYIDLEIEYSDEKEKDKEIERLNNKYNKALELLIDYNLPCEVDDFMNVHSDYCETHCGVDEERYKRCWNKFIEWKIGSDKEC